MVAFTQKVIGFIPALSTLFYKAAPECYDSASSSYAIAEFNSDITGFVRFEPAAAGEVIVQVKLAGLPDEGGPFLYHIHEFAVPTNGDCYSTGVHLNPYGGISPCAIAKDDSYCEAGDLSGKHGFIYGNSLEDFYVEKYISLNPDNVAYIGGLSVTIHLADNTRIACSNITFGEHDYDELLNKEVAAISNTTTSSSVGAAPVAGTSLGLFAAGAAGLAAVLL